MVKDKLVSPEPFRSHPVRSTFGFDSGPGDYRIGLLALSTVCVTERDFANMRPNGDVAICTSRVHNINPCTVENLKAMAPLITAATALMMPDSRLDVVAYDCTSATVVIGFEQVRASIRKARPGIPCVTPITAALAAFDVLAVSKVAVLTPYLDEVTEPIVRYLETSGLSVAKTTSFRLVDDREMAALPPQAIYQAALEADTPDAEALFISCTAVRGVDAVQRIEDKIGKPVVTSNQAMFWHSLRLAGCDERVPGYGRLLGRC